MFGREACFLLAAAVFALPANSAPVQSPFEMARSDFEVGHYLQAAETLRTAVAQNPRDPSLFYWLARCEFELRDFDHAASSAERAVALAPENSDYHLMLGRAYGRKAEQANWFSAFSLAKKSRREFEEAVRLNPANFLAQSDLIEFYARAPGIVGGGDDKALQQIDALAKIDPLEARLARVDYWEEKKKFGQADAEAQLVLQAPPRTAGQYFVLGDYYEKRKNTPGLRAVVEGAARVDPADPRLLYFRGVADFLAGGPLDEAEQSLRTYIDTVAPRSDRPSHCAARDWLGLLLEQQGRKDEAIAVYRRAIEREPHCKAAREALRRLQK
jgi:tetratricopeptide (TPR) repeat protein